MSALPTLPELADRLVELGVHEFAGWSEKRLRSTASVAAEPGALLADGLDRGHAMANWSPDEADKAECR